MKTLLIRNGCKTFVLLLVLFIQSLSGLAFSQQAGIRPFMKVMNLHKDEVNPMRLDILKIDIKIVGRVAVTTMDMTYFNDNNRLMVGEFNFPLGDGQTVSRFALDVNGVLREGVVVEKEKGRKTFESIVRRRVDPGLLEMTEGNNFRMRVYPLPAKGTRRVVFAFEQELKDIVTHDLYLLPLNIVEPVGKFSIHAEVVKQEIYLNAENNEISNFDFKIWRNSYVADFSRENYIPNQKVAFSFPHVADAPLVYTSGVKDKPNASYFNLTVRPEQFVEAKILPKHITLLWDQSNSAQQRNLEKELSVLDQYIGKIKNLSVELVSFNIKAGKPETFDIVNGNWDALKSALSTRVNDGGTSLGCLDLSKFTSDEILLFSDGLSNFGESEPKLGNTPVYTINSNFVANSAYLSYLSQQTGGVYINLNTNTNDEALTLLTNSNYHFISASVIKGDASDLYPSKSCTFDKSFSMSGKMSGKAATILLNFGFGKRVMCSKFVKINATDSTDEQFLRRLWAEKKIAELAMNPEKNKDEITRTGMDYSIVTPQTSLIVLENLSDYVQYGIVPPADMKTEYDKYLANSKKIEPVNVQSHMDQVVKMSAHQSKWWNTYYPIVRTKAQTIKNTEVVIADDVDVREEDEMKSEDVLSGTKVTISVMDIVGSNEVSGVKINDSESHIDSLGSSIQLNAWDPQTPYLKVLQYAHKGDEYKTYLKLKKEYGLTPAFYLDAADFFAKSGNKDTALVILSNLAELQLESPQLLRVMGYKSLEWKCYDEAILIFGKVLKMRGEEPQSYRDLGLALEAKGNYQRAIRTLYEVVKKDWDGRFYEVELVVMNEINRILMTHPDLDTRFMDKRLIKKEPVDVRVVLTWDTDNCDMDLWVTDPSGEKCFYGNALTHHGGKISNDFTGGYGPEEFMIKKAMNGDYLVQVKYYGTNTQDVLVPVNLHLVFYTNYGKPGMKKQEVTLRLEGKKDLVDVGKFTFKRPEKQP